MLESLRPFLDRSSSSKHINMPRLLTYLHLIESGTSKLSTRYATSIKTPIRTKGIAHINSLIIRADIPYLMKANSDLDLLFRVRHEYESEAYSDYHRQYSIKSRLFISSNEHDTAEYALLTEDFGLIESLPLYTDDIDIWMSSVRPVSLISCPSNEILMNLVSSRLRYISNPPLYAMFSINVMKLLTLYIKYRTHTDNHQTSSDNNAFIFKSCILPLLKDNTRMLMLHIINQMIDGFIDDKDYVFNIDSISYGEKSTFIHNGIYPGLTELADIIKKCAMKQVRPDEVLASVYTSTSTTIYDDIINLTEHHYIKTGIQYRWAGFIREYQLLSIVLGLFHIYGESSRTTEIYRLFAIVARRLSYTRFWDHIKDPAISKDISDKFSRLCTLYQVNL